MDKNRYKQIAERNKDNKMMLCYEVFCEEKKQIPYQVFAEALSQWMILQQPDVFVMGGSFERVTDIGLSRIVEFLNNKYEKD